MEQNCQAGGGQAPVLDSKTLAHRIRFVLYLAALAVFQHGVIAPSAQFIMLSFFASRHGGGDCEASPSLEPCRRGASDLAFYKGVSNCLSHGLGWTFALLTGSWSDTLGRQPFFVAKSLILVLPFASLALHVFGGFTLWAYLVFVPLVNVFDINAVFLACMNDLVPEPENRAVAFGVLIVAVVVFAGATLPFGGLLPRSAAVTASGIMAVLHIVFVTFFFPETSPMSASSKKALGLVSVLRSMARVFGSSSFILRMVYVLVLSGLALAGLGTLLVPYATGYLGMDRKMGAGFAFLSGTAVLSTLALGLKPMLERLGEVGTMRVSLAASVAYPLLVPLCKDALHFMVLTAVFMGPMAMQFPVISAIKSNLVGKDDQGVVQGALAAIRVLAVAVADAFFGWLYRHVTDGGAAPSPSAVCTPIFTTAGLSALAFLVACTLPTELPPPAPSSSSSSSEESESVELVFRPL